MSFFIAILVLFLIPLVLINAIHIARINHKLKVIADKIERQDGDQEAILSSYVDKVRKMGIYREAADNVEHAEARELFKKLLADEERHVKVLEKVVSK